jgi:hypothetical protein
MRDGEGQVSKAGIVCFGRFVQKKENMKKLTLLLVVFALLIPLSAGSAPARVTKYYAELLPHSLCPRPGRSWHFGRVAILGRGWVASWQFSQVE